MGKPDFTSVEVGIARRGTRLELPLKNRICWPVFREVARPARSDERLFSFLVGSEQQEGTKAIPVGFVREVGRVRLFGPVQTVANHTLASQRLAEPGTPGKDPLADGVRVGERVRRQRCLSHDLDWDALLPTRPLDDRLPIVRVITGKRADVNVEPHRPTWF